MRPLTIVLAFLYLGSVDAQDYTFKILVNKGQNEVKAGSNWKPVKVGASLKDGDELKIAPNGYVGLVHKTGAPLEVKIAGQYKVTDLATQIKESSSVLNKYTEFILSSSTVQGNSQTVTGAVHRGPNEIKLFLPPKNTVVFNDKISITWSKVLNTRHYILRFTSMFGDELEQYEVPDTTAIIDLSGPKLANEDVILLEISSKTDRQKVSEVFMLKKVSAADKERIKSSLAQVASQTSDQTALNNLFLASYFEDNKLLIDAASAYQTAIKLAPNVPYFQDAFNAFLARNGLTVD